MITPSIKSQIKNHAFNHLNEEVSGFIVKGNIVPCRNYAENKSNNVTIQANDYLRASLLGPIDFVYHTHHSDNTEFSELDKITLKNHNLKGILYNTKLNKFNLFLNNKTNSYIGRKFEISKQDCFVLVKDYFLNELKIKISDYQYDENWFLKNSNILLENYKKEGFHEVKKLQKNDVILIHYKSNDPPKHIMIYLDDNLILHQPRNKESLVEFYSDVYKRRTTHILRHFSCN